MSVAHAPVTTWPLFVDGTEHEASSGKTFDVVAPETGALVGRAALGDEADVALAVAAARRAFAPWANLPPSGRERILLACADAIERRGERFLDLLIDESGSTITKARGEIAYTAQLFRAAAGEARRLYGDTFPNDVATRMSLVIREPLGVVGVISPFNAPLALLAKMVAFPLAAGNTVVAKPSEETPLVAIELARTLFEAGLPRGVLSVVTGVGAGAGRALTASHDIDAIAFTGSTSTGVQIALDAAPRMRRVQLELGGKNALLVLADVDIARAAAIAVAGAFAHGGQICMAGSRVVVEEAIFEPFVAAFARAADALVVGDLRNEATAYGPLINEGALRKVQAHVAAAVAGGARIAAGGRVVRGLVYAPTVLVEPPRTSDVWREETFGPVASVVAARDLDDAVRIANDSAYGLSAGVLTNDVARALTAARRIRAGSVHVGMHSFQSNALAPIGGYGLSGIGRSGGKYSIDAFTELKWISLELGTAPVADGATP